jgi:autotransporter-associated beta strand protein
MKLRSSLLVAAALTLPTSLSAATFTWTGSAPATTGGAWNPANAVNWNGVTPVLDNTADIIFDGSTPIITYGTWLGDGNRMVRSLTFSNLTTQLEIRTNNNGSTARQIQYAADSGNATIAVDSTVTAPIIIGALAGDASQTNNGTHRLDSNLDIIHNGSALLTMRRPINRPTGGTAGINKHGPGTVLLAGDNNFGGDVNILAGTLRLSNSGALGNGPKNVSISSGATLEFEGNANPGTGYAATVSGTGVAGIGALFRSSGSNTLADTFSDGITLAGPTTIAAASGSRFGVGGNAGTGTTTGLHTLTKIGTGQFDLRGAITIGNVVVQEGSFQTQDSNWNDDGYTISFSPGTDFRLFQIGNTFPRDITLDNASITSSGSADFFGDTLSGNLTITGANTISSSGDLGDSLILTGNIVESAPGASLTIGGTRKVVLAGTNTYTGTTTVGDGVNTPTLQLDGSITSNISVADLATVGGDGSTTGTITLAPLSNILFDPSTTGPNEFLRAADFIIDPSDVIYVTPMKPGSGSPAVILRSEAGGLDLANFSIPDPGRATLSLGGSPANSELIFNANAANLEWRNFSANGIWDIEDLADNFQNLGTSSPDDFFLGDNVSFTDAATGTITLATNITAGNVVLNNTTGNDVEIAPSNLETIAAATLSTASSGDATISADIVGLTQVIVNGTGTLTLTGINTASAPININSGTLRLGSGGPIGSVASAIVNDSALVIDRSDTITLNQIISGTGTLTQAGTGTTILGTAHSYTGLTTISSGTLEINATGTIPGSILNNAALVLSGTTDKTFANEISGTGSVTKSGTHNLTFTGNNSFSGGLILGNGTLTADEAGVGTGNITFTGNGNIARWYLPDGTVAPNDILFADGATNNKVIEFNTPSFHAELTGTIDFAANSTNTGPSRISPTGGTIVVSGKMTGTGTGGFAKRQTGTVVITGTENDYTGATTITDAGTLLVNGSIQSNVFFGQNVNGSGGGTTSGTLGGSGLIGGNVSTRGDSNLSPGGASSAGVDTNTAATLTINGNLDISLSAGGVGLIRMDLDAPAGTNDRINAASATIGTDALGLTDFAFNNLGGLAAGTYTLISTTDGINGTLNPTDLTGEIAPGFSGSLSIVGGNDLVLTVSAGNAYDTWIATFGLTGLDAAFDFDYDNDGIDNGLEWILGGNPTIGDAASLYTVTGSAATGLTLAFDREEDSIGVATLTVEYGSTLTTWPGSVTIGATSSPADGNGVVVTVNDVPAPDEVTVNIPASNSASGKLFARLKATQP